MATAKNYIIYDDRIVAYTLGDLIAGIKEAYEEGYRIVDPYKVEKSGVRYRLGISGGADNEPEIPLVSITEEIIDSFEDFPSLREFASIYGISGRSVVGIKFKLKEAVQEATQNSQE